MKTIFTGSQVAEICKIKERTVSRWYKSEGLRGYRIPGSTDVDGIRIPREHLIRFLKEHNMSLGELEDEAMSKILLVGSDLTTRTSLNEMIANDDFKIEIAAGGVEAGIQAEYIHPDCVVIDFVMGLDESLSFVKKMNDEFSYLVVIGLISDDTPDFDRSAFTETFRKPIDAKQLADSIKELVAQRKQQG